MLDMLKVIILGIVEGITEWLPISSTGHLILVDENLVNTYICFELGRFSKDNILFFLDALQSNLYDIYLL